MSPYSKSFTDHLKIHDEKNAKQIMKKCTFVKLDKENHELFDPLADLSVKEYILDFDQQNEVNVTNTVTKHTVKLNKMTEKVSKTRNLKRKIKNKEVSSPLKRKKDENKPKLNCDFCEFVSSEKSILIEHVQAEHFKVEENEIDIPDKDIENKYICQFTGWDPDDLVTAQEKANLQGIFQFFSRLKSF